MTTTNDYDYLVDLTTLEGGLLEQFKAEVDFEPAVEWARLQALRCWQDATKAAEADITIEPRWHGETGAPYVDGFNAVANANGLASTSAEIPLRFFKSFAVRCSQKLIEQKKLETGQRFNYAVSAFPKTGRPVKEVTGDDEDFEEVPVPVELKRSSLRDFLDRSEPFGGEPDEKVLPVFVPQSVLDEAVAMTETAERVEAGAILIGHLHHDEVLGKMFLEVTEQIPAQHAVGSATKLTFNQDTWTAVDAAISLRQNDEHAVGWIHNHPARFWCDEKKCGPEARAKCPLGQPFFSEDDVAVHRTVFWKSFCVALVITNAEQGMKINMYGWDQGLVAPRSFHIINANGTAPRAGEEGAVGINPGEEHE